jgi:hypothetical protein
MRRNTLLNNFGEDPDVRFMKKIGTTIVVVWSIGVLLSVGLIGAAIYALIKFAGAQ